MKLIGAGFGRTGTASLKAALEELGYGPCHHMFEVFEHPERAEVWKSAYRGEPVDWDQLFDGYNATVDWPACEFYEPIARAYPQAKVLLSVRDPERWYESVRNTIYGQGRRVREAIERGELDPADPIIAARMRVGRMVDEVIWKGRFQGRFEDRDYAIDVFNRHNDRVKRTVPADRLLVFDVKEGWEPLCRFLEVPVPEGKPFPHLNDTASFQEILQSHVARSRSSEG